MEDAAQRLYAFPRNLVLAASAGTGKTHALVGVVVHLLVTDRARSRGRPSPPDPSRIVATTFSRKAAAEIRVRVAEELERLGSTPSSSTYVSSLRANGGAAPLDDRAISLRARRALARLGAARFGTLHSFATSLVRTYALELGLGPRFEIASEADVRSRTDDAIAAAIERRLASHGDDVRALSEAAGGIERLITQMRRALFQLAEDGRGPADLAVAAGDVLTIERSIEELVSHARALASSPRFAEAAEALVAASERRETESFERAAIAFCGVAASGKKTPELEAFAVFRKTLAGATNEDKGRRLVRTYLSRGRFAAAASLARDVLAEADAEIARVARAAGTLGFGELLRAARALLRDHPDVASDVANGVDALLVDEFQDTSRVQRDLIQLLWANEDARQPGQIPPLARIRGAGLLVVGDRKQSIYGFRGADVGVFAELAVGLAGEPARVALGIPAGVAWEPREPLADFHALRHNRRSEPEILAFANAFSARRFLPAEAPPAMFEIEYVRETEDLRVAPERGDIVLAAPRTTWLKITPKGLTSTRIDEGLVIARAAADLVRLGALRLGREERQPRWCDIAVLATTNGMLDAAAFALAQSDIPYALAGKSFFRTREVRDLAAMLRLVLDPTDRLAAVEVLRGPWAALSDESLLALTRPGEGLLAAFSWSAPDVLTSVDRSDAVALREVASVVTDLARCAGRLGPGAILREACSALRMDDVLRALPRGDQRAGNVRKLLSLADRHTDARAFLRWLDEATEQELAESEAATFSEDDDAVRLLTVHASKGLDFPIVFVPEIGAVLPRVEKGAIRILAGSGDEPNLLSVRIADNAGILLESPSFARSYAVARRRERAERQRLAYVAVTRASDAMYLVGGRTREGSGDLGASSLAVLEELGASAAARAEAALAIEDVDVPLPSARSHESALHVADVVSPAPRPFVPAWRSLPIAPTALADFAHCARRFELVHVLGMPEYVRGGRVGGSAAPRGGGSLDARTQGTIAHAVLERIPTSAFAGEEAEQAVSEALQAEGIPTDHGDHAAIAGRVRRFLSGDYARSLVRAAEVRREAKFVLPVADTRGREIVLRGSMDLVVLWPDGAVDVVDYKSARSAAVDAHAFQLDVYALAARRAFPAASRLRVGLVFLGGRSGEPTWRVVLDENVVRQRLNVLADDLVNARWSGRFPRVELARCESIHCGFIGRCHAEPPSGETTAKR